jgi:hypothetical protein
MLSKAKGRQTITGYRRVLLFSVPAVLSILLPFRTLAQEVDELARQTQNPIANLISVPLQGNWDMGIGDRDATGTLLNFQPVLPFEATPGMNIILRVIMPLTSQPTPTGQRINGFSDIVTTAFFSPSKVGRFMWGAGPVVQLPSATNAEVGSEKFALGPSIVLLKQPGEWTIGFLGNQVWSVDGAKDREAVNQAFLQPFAFYNMGNGMSAGLNMEATVKWEADNGKVTAPLLLSISKVALLGKRPVNFQVAAGPMIASPDGGAKWRFRLGATFLFPR